MTTKKANKLFEHFTTTGKIDDYLNYRKAREEEKNERTKQEQILREKYNFNNVFEKNSIDDVVEERLDKKYLVEVKEASWYTKLIHKILNFFKKQ